MFTGFGGFPFSSAFDDFGEFGAFSHRRPRHNPPTFKHYDTLGISREATPAQIRKAFNQLAMRVHPDKGSPSDCRSLCTLPFQEATRKSLGRFVRPMKF